MTKLLFIIGVTILVVFFIKRAARRGGDISGPKPGKDVEDMVRCHVCGVNLPRSEALMSRGEVYCCEEHRQKDQ